MKDKWLIPNLDLGIIKEDKKYTLIYESFDNLNFKSIKPGCPSCTFIEGYKDKVLKVTFFSPVIPKHIKGEYNIFKNIYIIYDDNTEEKLTFKATVKK